jgi:hypothetical protein
MTKAKLIATIRIITELIEHFTAFMSHTPTAFWSDADKEYLVSMKDEKHTLITKLINEIGCEFWEANEMIMTDDFCKKLMKIEKQAKADGLTALNRTKSERSGRITYKTTEKCKAINYYENKILAKQEALEVF